MAFVTSVLEDALGDSVAVGVVDVHEEEWRGRGHAMIIETVIVIVVVVVECMGETDGHEHSRVLLGGQR